MVVLQRLDLEGLGLQRADALDRSLRAGHRRANRQAHVPVESAFEAVRAVRRIENESADPSRSKSWAIK